MRSRTWLISARTWRLTAWLLSLGVAASAHARISEPPNEGPDATAVDQPKATDSRFLRVVEEKNQSIALEIVSRTYVKPDGTGPKVGLIGVAHIGDRAFYRGVQNLLDDYDLVLYESVRPAGTSKPGGENDEQRIESTKQAMQFVGGLIEAHRTLRDAYPVDLQSLEKFTAEQDVRLAQWLALTSVDAWGNSLVYAMMPPERPVPEDEDVPDDAAAHADPASRPDAGSYTLISLGADGQPGGEDAAADIALADQPQPDPFTLVKEDNLQEQLADALNLEFQLVALDYGRPNWRCSDMAMDELSRSLEAKGVDFGPIGGTLAGSSLPAKLISVFLGFMRMADSFMDGAISDTFKVVMIEMLGDERLLETSLAQFGDGFADVIVRERNQVALDDLNSIMANEPEIKSVAILYGAAHMPDMRDRLAEQFGYEPADETWLTAIKVDLTQSAVSPREINQIRMMMKRMIRQQLRGPS